MHDMCALLSGYDENAAGAQASPWEEHTDVHVCEETDAMYHRAPLQVLRLCSSRGAMDAARGCGGGVAVGRRRGGVG